MSSPRRSPPPDPKENTLPVPATWNLGKMAALYEELLGEAEAVSKVSFRSAVVQPVLAVHSGKHIQRSELEIQLELREVQQHLDHIYQHPRRTLRCHEEVLAAPRVKRISPRAILDLTSRSSRWRRRTLRGIEPREVLALIHEDVVDRYENRLAADFLDRVVNQLNARLDELQEMESLFELMREFQSSAEGGTSVWYRLTERLYGLWGQSADHLSDARRRLQEVSDSIERLRDWFMAHRSLALYSGLPPAHQVPDTIHETNILINDQHYRHLPPLWHKMLEGRKRPSKRSSLGEKEKAKYDTTLFQKFALGVVARALKSLRFVADPTVGGRQLWNLKRDGDVVPLTVEMTPSSEIVFTNANVVEPLVLRLVSVAGVESSPDLAQQFQQWVSNYHFRESARHFIVVSGVQEGAGSHPATARNAGPAPILSISPFDLWSVERIGRAIRDWLDGSRLRAFPFELRGIHQRLQETFPENAPIEWSSQSRCFLVWGQLPPTPEWRLRRPLRQHERTDIEELHVAVESAQKQVDALLRCPVCGEPGEFAAAPERKHRTYIAKCRACSSQWGVAGKGREPFLRAGPEGHQDARTAGLDGLGNSDG